MEREKELKRKLEASEKAGEEARGLLKENIELRQQVGCPPNDPMFAHHPPESDLGVGRWSSSRIAREKS